MDADHLFELLTNSSALFLVSATALVMAVIAIFSAAAARRRLQEQNEVLKQRVDTLWQDMDDMRVSQFNSPGAPGATDATAGERFATEKAAYDAIWPLVWSLHDKLGMFLRSVEADEPAGELRLEARNAALEARTTLNRVRPFCHGEIEELITHLIDNHIKAHLAACHFMDLRKDSLSSGTSHEQEVQKEKFRMLYDGQAKEMLAQLVTAIRRRTLR